MAGGLVQLVSYGSEDIFLTGSPQITFFKIVYRRHSNFAIESTSHEIHGLLNFGGEAMTIIEKTGDLLNRIYLEIDLPKVDLLKHSTHRNLKLSNINGDLDITQKYYQLVNQYITEDIKLIKELDILIKINNITVDQINKILNQSSIMPNFLSSKENLETFLREHHSKEITKTINDVNQIDIYLLFQSATRTMDDGIIRKYLNDLITKQLYPRIQQFYLESYQLYHSLLNKKQAIIEGKYQERYQFAWVEEIGHSIIDYIDLTIGNQLIDKHTGDWLTVYNQLTMNSLHKESYNEMIGQVDQLIMFDDKIKEKYKLIIPLQFWFCRHTGNSLPLIALHYHDINLNIKLKDLSDLCYVENDNNLLNIPNIQSQYDININHAKLYVDYIFLDTDERTRFAQSTHEYLIEVVQLNQFDNLFAEREEISLNFSHATKMMAWFLQPTSYRQNADGRTKAQWNNFGIKPDHTGQSLDSAYIKINTHQLTNPYLNIEYFNLIQPYLYFNHSVADGLYVYSFSIKPLEQQPSGSINLSRIDDFKLILNINKQLLEQIRQNNEQIYLGVYTVSYNILRIMGGMAGLAFGAV